MSQIEYANIDHLFAKNLLKEASHPLYTFCLDLMKASREGHLFIQRESVDPSIDEILTAKNAPIIKDGNAYYLSRNFYHEQEIATLLSARTSLPKLNHNISAPIYLNTKQHEAFTLLNFSPFFLITGGPGSGKSFVAKEMIRAFKNRYPDKKVICTAPTGKALSALSQSHEESKTLHKLLTIKEGFDSNPPAPMIVADLLIVDECSMISPKLFNLLFLSLLDITQVILIGDPHQLPPVSGASIFYDFTTLTAIDQVTLLAPMRSEKQSIIDFSSAIALEDEGMIRNILAISNEITISPLASFNPKKHNPGHILLTPFRKGPFGSLQLNEQIRPNKDCPIPIMITKNDSLTNLTNGDIGYLDHQIATFPEKNITLPKLMLPPYEKAFALSIHKSQGSEFDHVSIILPEEAKHFPKELLFTGITRARKSIQLFGSLDTLIQLIKNKRQTSSKLLERFNNLSN